MKTINKSYSTPQINQSFTYLLTVTMSNNPFRRWLEASAKEKYRERDYIEEHQSLFIIAAAAAVAFQVYSGWSELSYASALFKSTTYPTILGLLAVVAYELMVTYLLSRLFYVWFQKSKISVPILLMCLALNAGSFYASWSGVEVEAAEEVNLPKYDPHAGITHYTAMIATVDKDIQSIIARNTWKGKTWLPADEKAKHDKLVQHRNSLQAQAANEQARLRADYERENAEALNQRGHKATEFRWIIVATTIGLFIAMYFMERFSWEIANMNGTYSPHAEAPAEPNKSQAKTLPLHAEAPEKPELKTVEIAADSRPKIGFNIPEKHDNGKSGNRKSGFEIVCAHCGKQTTMLSPRAKFCSDTCRLSAANNKEGK